MPSREGLRRRKPQPNVGSAERNTLKEGRVSICRSVLKFCLLVAAALFSLLFLAYLTAPTSCHIISDSHDAAKVKWGSMNNSDLTRGKRILTELHGPESIVVDENGFWYTGLHDGRLVKIQDGQVPSVVDTIEMPDFSDGKRSMKRPLGLRLHGKNLYVADGYQGLFSLRTDNLKWDKIVGYDDVSPPMFFPDDITISRDGNTIYLTDISTRWMYDEVVFSILEGECTGRVFKVDLPSKRVTEVRGGLCFPNGIQLNHNETHLLVSENARKRVTVMDAISGETVKQVFLHGGPDNIRPSKSGGYWVAIPSMPDSRGDSTNDYPFVRDILARLLGAERLLKFINLNHGTVVKLNEEYDITHVHSDRDGKVCGAITEVQELKDGRVLLGTFIYHGLVVVDDLGKK